MKKAYLSYAFFSLIAFLCLTIFPHSVHAAVTGYDWGYYLDEIAGDEAYEAGTFIDSQENVVTVGYVGAYGDTIDFDPTSGVNNTTVLGQGMYLTKFSNSGSYLWTKVIKPTTGGNYGGYAYLYDSALDSNNNLYITGRIGGATYDFDPGAGTSLLTSAGGDDMFFAKYNSSGELQWAYLFSSASFGGNMVVDSEDNIIIHGRFQGTQDFDPGAGTTSLTSGSEVSFIAKYTSSAGLVWVKNASPLNSYTSKAMGADSLNNIYITYNNIIYKYDSSGNAVWNKSLGSNSWIYGGIAFDTQNNLYAVVELAGSNQDFDPGAGTQLLSRGNSDSDVVILKLDVDGVFQWVRQIGPGQARLSSGRTRGLTIAGTNIYALGRYTGTVDFDGTAGTDSVTSSGDTDQDFITNYTTDGSYVDTFFLGGDGNQDYTQSLTSDLYGNLVVGVVSWNTSIDLNPFGTDIQTNTSGTNAPFIAKMTIDHLLVHDTTAPVITSVSSLPAVDVTITWISDEEASSQLNYGLTSSYGTSTTETDTSPRVTSHSVSLSGLAVCTTYHYRVVSTDAQSNTYTGEDATFTTTGCLSDSTTVSNASSSITKASGGTVTLTGDSRSAMLTVPSNFTDDGGISSSVFQIHRLTNSQVLDTAPVPASKLAVANGIYQFTSLPTSTTFLSAFASPITITITYTDSDISGLSEGSLGMYRYNTSTLAWDRLSGCTQETSTNTLTCPTSSFSNYALFADAAAGGTSPSVATTLPDLPANDGGVVKHDVVIGILEPETLSFDTNLSVSSIEKNHPFRVGSYWQLSKSYDIWLTSFHNGARVLKPSKKSILALKYEVPQDLTIDGRFKFLEKNLRLAWSGDEGKTWKVLQSSAVDTTSKTVAMSGYIGGRYAIVGSMGVPSWVLGVQTLYPTPTPTPQPRSKAMTPTVTMGIQKPPAKTQEKPAAKQKSLLERISDWIQAR